MTNKEYLKNHFDDFLNEIISSYDFDDICIADILIKIFPWSIYPLRGESGESCDIIGCKKCIDDFLNKECEEV